MRHRSYLVLAALLLAAPASAEPGTGEPIPSRARSVRLAVEIEVAKLAATKATVSRRGVAPKALAAARRRNWFQRHPVGTAAIAGFLSGFAIGWAAGDDAVFDDFTGEFNGVMLGGICAGSAASVVAIVKALDK